MHAIHRWQSWRTEARAAAIALLLILAGCAAYTPPEVTTQSVSSAGSNPTTRYRAIVVFVENVDPGAQLTAEEAIVATLKKSGVRAKSSLEVFNYSRSIDDVTKANVIRSQGFDGALFVTLVRAETTATPAQGVLRGSFNGIEMLCEQRSWGQTCTTPAGTQYSVDATGKIVVATSVVVTQATLQDVHTAQQVWAGETTASVNTKFGTTDELYELAARNVVAKLRQDQLI